MKIKELLKNPEKWTTGTCYRDINGKECLKEEARSYCLYGAVCKCYGDDSGKIIDLLLKQFPAPSVWNDESTHAEVLALVEKLDI